MSHTPGPWTVGTEPGDSRNEPMTFTGRTPFWILKAGSPDPASGYADAVAAVPRGLEDDARLIAAAPDLLAALERVAFRYHNLNHQGDHADCESPSCCAALSAIAKATGEQVSA